MHVIVSAAYDTVEAYEATIENAQTILSWQQIPADVVAFAANRPEHYTTYDVIARVVQKLLTLPEMELAFNSSRDATRNIVATQEAKQELVMYCFDKHISPTDISAYTIKSSFDIKDLQCLSKLHDTPIVDEWMAGQASKYATITNNRWKETATDISKVNYIINFVNEHAHRDERYHVVKVTSPC